ncbi:MAG: diphosphokinase / guanosine-3,5-bis(diphosphate) 3-diphosphatase [Blastocatellia bacterium]|jgi:hypothetical protein|nr:diphosphokinase / guanosine-3,5-bis(diphosphate) 3-diphosphatase [Blastocatellia bacterium]
MANLLRDEFPLDVKRTISFRVGSRCSLCYEPTSGPKVDPTKALNIGVAAHITAASSGGPRYDPQLTRAERRHATNAIWLCQNCARLIDNDPERFSIVELRRYKDAAEAAALERLTKSIVPTQAGALITRDDGTRELAIQLAESQAQKFQWIRRYPFTEIDRVSIGDALRLSAEDLTLKEQTSLLVPVSEIAMMNRANILFGEPGSGKSTALQQITHDEAHLFCDGFSPMPPLYVDLKWHTNDLVSLVDRTVMDLCPTFDMASISRFVMSSAISYYFDSFDEASDSSQLVRDIKAFVSQHPQSRFVIASRPNNLLGNLNYVNYEMAPLNRAQIREELELYLESSINPSDIWRIYEDVKEFGLFAELGNPLMLWFFCLAIRDLGADSSLEFLGKGRIFHQVVEGYFLSNWEPKSLPPWAVHGRKYAEIKMALLSSLARKMIEDGDRSAVETSWVFERFVAELNASYTTPPELAHEVLDQILIHHLLEEKGSQVAFWHKSLRNYFAARTLINESDAGPVEDFATKPEWYESLVMLASLDPKMASKIDGIARVDSVVALDCLLFSPLAQDPCSVESVVHHALTAFFSPRPREERVRIIQRFSALYKRAPDLVNQVAFAFVHSEKLDEYKSKYKSFIRRESILSSAVEKLRTALIESEIEASIHFRIKSLSSLIRKVLLDDEGDHVYDVFGIRILTPNVRGCYAILGVAHDLWKPIPGHFKDYVATANNGYQALHSCVLLKGGIPLEVIIQTHEMQEHSQRTRVAYLESKYDKVLVELEKKQEALGLFTIPIVSQVHGRRQIAVFTPKEGLLLVHEDSTVLDCAYRIHSEIFAHCIGAIVNGRTVDRGYPLKNLDHLEILTDPRIAPEAQWTSSISSASAQKALRRILRRREEAEAIAVGERLVETYVATVLATSLQTREAVEASLLRRLGLHKIENVYMGVAIGKYHLADSQTN